MDGERWPECEFLDPSGSVASLTQLKKAASKYRRANEFKTVRSNGTASGTEKVLMEFHNNLPRMLDAMQQKYASQ